MRIHLRLASGALAIVVSSALAGAGSGAKDPPGTESVVLREDGATGGLELLARYPAGHVFPPHWHAANERIVLLEGRLSVRDGETERFLERGGFAYVPAREGQRLSCVSRGGFVFYVGRDGAARPHAAEAR
jgi:quercetin dioxygenase-like cupin family protein